jgi:hypothetical protein
MCYSYVLCSVAFYGFICICGLLPDPKKKRKEKEVASLLPIAPAWECIN